jgi:hypothetical protein
MYGQRLNAAWPMREFHGLWDLCRAVGLLQEVLSGMLADDHPPVINVIMNAL